VSAGLHHLHQGGALQLGQAEVTPSCSGTVGKHEQQRPQQLVHALALSAAVQHPSHLVPVGHAQIAHDMYQNLQRNGFNKGDRRVCNYSSIAQRI
jgi:hypothetical protein